MFVLLTPPAWLSHTMFWRPTTVLFLSKATNQNLSHYEAGSCRDALCLAMLGTCSLKGRASTKRWTSRNRWCISASSQQINVNEAVLSCQGALQAFPIVPISFFLFFNPFLSKNLPRPDLQLGATLRAQTVLSRFVFTKHFSWVSITKTSYMIPKVAEVRFLRIHFW